MNEEDLKFDMGIAKLEEPTRMRLNGKMEVLGPGHVCVLKLYERGIFRCKIEWWVSVEEEKDEKYKENNKREVQKYRKMLLDHWRQSRIKLQ